MRKEGSLSLGGKGSQELLLLLDSLETAVTIFGRGVDELDVEGLQVRSLVGGDETLSEGDRSLSRTGHAALDHQPVLVDLSVVREAAHRGDALLREICVSGGGVDVSLLADAKDSLVDLGTVVITLLTSAGYCVTHTSRVPSTDTGDLTETSVGLTRQASDAPTTDDTGKTVTAGSGADVDDLALREELGDLDFLLEKSLSEFNLGGDITSVDLDLEKVRNLCSELDLANLGVGKHSDNVTVLLDALDLGLDLLWLLGSLLGVLGESLLLGVIPILVESALDLLRKVTGPDGGECAKAVGCGDVSDNSNDNHWG